MEYLRPSSVGEAIDVLESSRGTILAGGTDLCVYMAEGFTQPETLIDITGIESMRTVENTQNDLGESVIRIGACTTIAVIASSETLPTCLRQGAQALGSPQIRNLGTIGGNICNASPCGDTLTPLLSLDAQFVLRSGRGIRRIDCGAFFTGPKKTALETGEILEFVEVPAVACKKRSAFRMIGNRKGQAISQVNAAVSLTFADGKISDVRVAVGSVAPIPLRLERLEQLLAGKRIGDLDLTTIRERVLEGIRPIDDVRSSAGYRRDATVALVFDALTECVDRDAVKGEGADAC